MAQKHSFCAGHFRSDVRSLRDNFYAASRLQSLVAVQDDAVSLLHVPSISEVPPRDCLTRTGRMAAVLSGVTSQT